MKSGGSREQWREALVGGHDVSQLCAGPIEISGNIVFDVDEIGKMSKPGKLALALLQIAQGVNVKFLKLPFAAPDDDQGTVVLRWNLSICLVFMNRYSFC